MNGNIMASLQSELNKSIIDAVAHAIRQHDPIDEIQDLLVLSSSSYRMALDQWREPGTRFNILQLSVVCGHTDATKYFCTFQNLLQATVKGQNPPLQIACQLGWLDIVRFFVEDWHMDITLPAPVTYLPTQEEVDILVDRRSRAKRLLPSTPSIPFSNIPQTKKTASQKLGDLTSFLFSCKKSTSANCEIDENDQLMRHSRIHNTNPDLSNSKYAGKGQSKYCHKDASLSQSPVKHGCVSITHSCNNAQLSCRADQYLHAHTNVIDVESKLRFCVNETSTVINESGGVRNISAYEVSVSAGQLDCANYLVGVMVQQVSRLLHPIRQSSVMHQAAYLGSSQHLALLLEDPSCAHLLGTRDRVGFTPLYIAALVSHAECLRVLLMGGADINTRSSHHGALHVLYTAKSVPSELLGCTRVLIEGGIDLNMMDHNSNTALDYLAWELGHKWVQPSLDVWFCNRPKIRTLTESEYYQEIYLCMEALLEAGASTLVRGDDNRLDHTIVHTLLQNTGWPLNSSLRINTKHVFRALSLFFKHGADPNVVARNNQLSALTMLLLISLPEVPNQYKLDFVHLFVINGADLESLVTAPQHHRENYLDRRWGIYPVMVALQERHPIEVACLLYDYMPMKHIYRSIQLMKECHFWHPMTWTANENHDQWYRSQWQTFCRPRVRTLKHIVKLVILRACGHHASKTKDLPLPAALLQYLVEVKC